MIKEVLKNMKIYKCDICGKEFNSAYKLGGHKGSHSRKKGMIKNKQFEIIHCLFCDKKIKIPKSNINNIDKKPKFCSHDCYYNYKNKLKNSLYVKLLSNNELQQIDITYNQYYFLKNNVKQCEICHKHFTDLRVDHCHNSNKFRGMLCSHCNGMLGWYENNKNDIDLYLAKNLNDINIYDYY